MFAGLQEKRRELELRRDEIPDQHMYLAELRLLKKRRHPTKKEWVRTPLSKDVIDCMSPRQADCTLYWDRFDEGIFIGGSESGSPVHVDQVSWSNVGKVCGRPRLIADGLHRAANPGDRSGQAVVMLPSIPPSVFLYVRFAHYRTSSRTLPPPSPLPSASAPFSCTRTHMITHAHTRTHIHTIEPTSG